MVMSINETKLNNEDNNISVDGYTLLRRDRDSHGGGVAFLIKHGTQYLPNDAFKSSNLEAIAIDVYINNQVITIISYYNPPPNVIPQEFFNIVQSIKNNVIICGDLNSKYKAWHCKSDNPSGQALYNQLLNSNFTIINDDQPTYQNYASNNTEILDLFIVSSQLVNKCNNFQVLDNDMGSDHYPMIVDLQYQQVQQQPSEIRLNYRRTNWDKYRQVLDQQIVTQQLNQPIDDIDSFNDKVTNAMLEAIKQSTPPLNPKHSPLNLPSYVLDLIKIKSKIKKQQRKFRSTALQELIKTIENTIKCEVNALKCQDIEQFCKQATKRDLAETRVWRRIKQLEEGHSETSSPSIPVLKHNNQTISDDEQKANVFGTILRDTFSDQQPTNKFDDKFKQQVDEFIKSNQLFKPQETKPFTLNELNQTTKKLKNNGAPGPDGIHNKMIKEASTKFKAIILNLFNATLFKKQLPQAWKIAKVTMIRKKDKDKHSPSSYRPISLTSCLGKTSERLILTRLIQHLNDNKIIIPQQSGFRKYRQTHDNIVYILQKATEGFFTKSKTLGIQFDIEKAFDKVWHNGLKYKLHLIQLEQSIGNWICNFLDNRIFYVQVNNSKSMIFPISAGVPQGAVLSPTLFSIFINDVPVKNKRQKGKSTLFADDLSTLFQDRNLKRVVFNAQMYLNELEPWLFKWRLSMSAEKCSYIVFSKTQKPISVDLQLFGKPIPMDDNPRYLGVKLDRKLTLKQHVEYIQKRAFRRLNIIKYLSNRKWHMNKEVLLSIYKVMVRSVIEYAPSILVSVSNSNIKPLQGIQYAALRAIFKCPIGTSSTEMHHLANIKTIRERGIELNNNYINNALANNELIKMLHQEYREQKYENDHLTYFAISNK